MEPAKQLDTNGPSPPRGDEGRNVLRRGMKRESVLLLSSERTERGRGKEEEEHRKRMLFSLSLLALVVSHVFTG